jgi:hypothetical protein
MRTNGGKFKRCMNKIEIALLELDEIKNKLNVLHETLIEKQSEYLNVFVMHEVDLMISALYAMNQRLLKIQNNVSNSAQGDRNRLTS